MDYYSKWSTYRRKVLDSLQEKYKSLYHGIVLDIGGRDRGIFKKPKNQVEKWIFADINEDYNPDVLLDVTDMGQVNTESIDVVNALELFEHVDDISSGLNECYRVLKKGGNLILSVPYLFPIHADPYDFQRWSDKKWRMELIKTGFTIDKFIITGKYYTTLGDFFKIYLKTLRKPLRRIASVFFPILDKMVRLDQKSNVKYHDKLNKFHSGYFIIAFK